MGCLRTVVATSWDYCPYSKSNANAYVHACAYRVFPDLVCRKTLIQTRLPQVLLHFQYLINKREMTSIDQWRHIVFFQKKKSKLEQIFYDHYARTNISCPCTPGICPLSQNYHQISWYPYFKLKVGILWSFF